MKIIFSLLLLSLLVSGSGVALAASSAASSTASSTEVAAKISFCFSSEQPTPSLPFLKGLHNFIEKHLNVAAHLCGPGGSAAIGGNSASSTLVASSTEAITAAKGWFEGFREKVTDWAKNLQMELKKALFHKLFDRFL